MTPAVKWPRRHWAGRCEAVKVLRECINQTQPVHLTADEATEIAEAMLQAYLAETQRTLIVVKT